MGYLYPFNVDTALLFVGYMFLTNAMLTAVYACCFIVYILKILAGKSSSGSHDSADSQQLQHAVPAGRGTPIASHPARHSVASE